MSGDSHFGRLGRHTLIYGIGVVAGRAIGFAMLPIYTRLLSPSDYGVLQLVEMTLDIIATVAGSRLGAGVFHLFHKAEGEQERREVLGAASALLGISYAVAGAIAWFAAPAIASVVLRSPESANLVRLAALSVSFQGLIVLPLTVLQVRERSVQYVVAVLGKTLLQLTLNLVFLLVYHLGLRGVFLSTLCANAVFGIWLALDFVRSTRPRFSKKAAKDILRLGLPFIWVQLGKFVDTYADRYFLQGVANAAVVGIYGLSYQFGFLLVQLGFAPFAYVWEPMRFEIAKRADRDAIMSRVFLYLNVVLISAAVAIAVFVGDLLRVMAAAPFQSAGRIVPIILLAYVAQSWTGFHNIGLFIKERTDRITWIGFVASGVALVGYALLIPRWFGLGAALATLASFAVREWLTYRESQALWPIHYEWGSVWKLGVLGVLAMLVAAVLTPVSIVQSLTFHVLLFAGYTIGVLYSGVLPQDVRQVLLRTLRAPRASLAALRVQT